MDRAAGADTGGRERESGQPLGVVHASYKHVAAPAWRPGCNRLSLNQVLFAVVSGVRHTVEASALVWEAMVRVFCARRA